MQGKAHAAYFLLQLALVIIPITVRDGMATWTALLSCGFALLSLYTWRQLPYHALLTNVLRVGMLSVNAWCTRDRGV